jgi:hypothetical protein
MKLMEAPVVGDVIAGLSSFKAMFDIAKSMKDLDDAVKRNSAVSDLWEQIITAQARYTAALEQVGELKEELTRFETWETEKHRYELKQLYRGPFAYILREGQENGEDPHAICTNCYQRGFKSVLQMSGHVTVHDRTWHCPACKMEAKGTWPNMADWIKRTRNPASV